MTNEEHIEQLKNIGCGGWTVTADAYESLKWAIEALEQEPRLKGHWEFDEKGYFSCSECKRKPKDQTVATDFCPHCGADMREGE